MPAKYTDQRWVRGHKMTLRLTEREYRDLERAQKKDGKFRSVTEYLREIVTKALAPAE